MSSKNIEVTIDKETTVVDGIVHKRLPCGKVCRTTEEVYNRLQSLGVSDNWFLNKDGSGDYIYVRFSSTSRRNNSQIARVIVGLQKGDRRVVRYKDGDPTNLCPDNLEIVDRARSGRMKSTPRKAKPGDADNGN